MRLPLHFGHRTLGIFNQGLMVEERTGIAIGYLTDELILNPFKIAVGNKRTDGKLNKPPRNVPILYWTDHRVTIAFLREVWEDFAERPMYNLNYDLWRGLPPQGSRY